MEKELLAIEANLNSLEARLKALSESDKLLLEQLVEMRTICDSILEKYKMLDLHQVIELTNLSKTSIYNFMRKGLFPKSIKITNYSVRWYESDIKQWLEERNK